MSVLLALAIILAIIATVRAVKSVRLSVAKPTTGTSIKTHADATTSVVDIFHPEGCMEAAIMVLAYTKASLKEERLNGRRARARAWHINNCASKEAAHINGAEKRKEITLLNEQRRLGRAAQKALVREAQAQGVSVAKLLARKAQGAAQRAINAARKAAKPAKTATTKVVKVAVAPVVKAAPSVKVAPVLVVRPGKARTYVRQAANKPTTISGAQLAEQARTTGANLATQIRVAKATLESLYAILPLARQVVALQHKANRKVGMYTWLADEGYVGVRSTKSSIARRDAAQDIVCQATLAAEAFKEAYGIEAQDVVSQILVVKAAKARAAEMLRDHKAEQHRLFIERQERRAAKAALKASKAAPAPAPAVTEIADWKEYVAANNGNKAIAFGILHATNATIAQKAAAIAAINGLSQDHHLEGKCTADAAYVVAA